MRERPLATGVASRAFPKDAVRAVRLGARRGAAAADRVAGVMRAAETRLTEHLVGASGLPDVVRELAPSHPSLRRLACRPTSARAPQVKVLTSLNPGGLFGGVATLLYVGATLAAESGHDLEVVQTTAPTEFDVQAFLRSASVPVPRVGVSRTPPTDVLEVHDDDIFVVSAWWDAARLAEALPGRPFVYLVQDYEPIFYPNGDDQLWARATYDIAEAVFLVNTSVLREFMSGLPVGIDESTPFFEPAVAIPPGDRGRTNGRRRLFFYGRPNVARNLYGTGLQAIEQALMSAQLGDEWEVLMAGGERGRGISLRTGHTVSRLGKLDLDSYRQFCRTVDVCLSPMLAPHPNYPTLEMASAGARVVTTRWENKTDLSRYGDAIWVVEPTVDALATALVEAAAAEPGSANLPTSWTDALQGPVRRVLRDLGGRRAA